MNRVFTAAVLLAVLLPAAADAQFTPTKVNVESLSPVYTRNRAMLIPAGDSGFLTYWQSGNPEGLPVTGQLFSAAASKAGTNFGLRGNEAVAASGSGVVLSINRKVTETWPEQTNYLFYTSVRSATGDTSAPEFLLETSVNGSCSLGWLGYNLAATAVDSHFLVAGQGGGRAVYRRLSANGDTIRTLKHFFGNSAYAVPHALQNSRGSMLAWMHSDYGYWRDSLPPGLYATFFNGQDQCIKDSVLVHSGTYNYPFAIYYPQYRVIPVQDTLYRIFVLVPDSLRLYTSLYTSGGTRLSGPDVFPLNQYVPAGYTSGFNLSVASGYAAGTGLLLFFTAPGSTAGAVRFTLDAWGRPTAVSSVPGLGYTASGYYHQTTASDIYYPRDIGGDVYLVHYRNFASVDSVLLPDAPSPVCGTQDTAPGVVPLMPAASGRAGFFVTWATDNFRYGRFCDADGIAYGQQQRVTQLFPGALPNNRVGFFQKRGTTPDSLFLTVYDSMFNNLGREFVTKDFFCTGNEQVVRQSDTASLTAFRQAQGTGIYRFNAGGKVTGYIRVPVIDSSGTAPQLAVTEDGSVWLFTKNTAVKTDAALQRVLTSLQTPVTAYLGNGVLLRITTAYGLIGELINETGTVLTPNIQYSYSASDWGVFAGPSAFAVTFSANNAYYGRTANPVSGLVMGAATALHPVTPFARKNFKASANPVSGQMAVVYQEARDAVNLNDIYISTGTISQITGTEKEVPHGAPGACIAYPNPATDAATVMVPATGTFGNCTVTVFSMQGEQTLVSFEGNLPPQGGRIALPLHRLPSGFYIIQVQKGRDFFRTKLVIYR